VKRYIELSGAAFERTTSENALLRKEITEARELSRVRKECQKGKRVAIKGKFVFNTQEILELVEEAEAEASNSKTKKRRMMKTMTPGIEDEEKEGTEENISENESDCIIVACSIWFYIGRPGILSYFRYCPNSGTTRLPFRF
jgi:hypothetical protein